MATRTKSFPVLNPKGGRPSPYSPDQKSLALRLYESVGPSEAAKATGIRYTTIRTWARREGVKVKAVDRVREGRDLFVAKRQLRREDVRAGMLDKIDEALRRMSEPYVEYVGRDAVRVVYDKPPAEAFRAFAQSVSTLMRELRTELGETTKSIDVTFRAQVDAVARNYGLDPADVLAEAERIALEASTVIIDGEAQAV
jgi:hypothetical protein